MTLNNIFLAFMAVMGAAAGAALVVQPELRDFRISPYFWILIAMAAFEIGVFAVRRGAGGAIVSMEVRLLGFVIAIVLMVLIPVAAGSPGRLF